MATGAEGLVATVVVAVVTASLPFYLYGAWIVLSVDVVTWRVLVRHLAVVGVGLVLTTGPVVVWMLPRLFERFDGFAALHAFLGFQAYALLVFALTGIVRIFQAKRAYNLYHEPDRDVDLAEIHPDIDSWRFRLRVGVFGYLFFWILAWIIGIVRYALLYPSPL